MHSKKGVSDMSWIRQNSFISMVFIFTLTVLALALLTNKDVEQTEQVYVNYGETLWSLADQYHGKMTKHDWIQYVEKLNHLESKNIVAGTRIEIPVIENSDYLQQYEQVQQHEKVAKK